MLEADFHKYILKFKSPVGTSRGVYYERVSWFISIWDEASPEVRGIGECAPLPGLSPELETDLAEHLLDLCRNVANADAWLYDHHPGYSSCRMGLETALADFRSGGRHIIYPSDFTNGRKIIAINGLIWMGDRDFMRRQIREKLEKGFRCIKLKIGALEFDQEIALIRELRRAFPRKRLKYGWMPTVPLHLTRPKAF